MTNRVSSMFRLGLCVLLLLVAAGYAAIAQVPSGYARIHYHRTDGKYAGWGLYTWNASTENNAWCTSEVAATGTDRFGVYFDVSVNPTQGSPAGELDFIINDCATGGTKDPGPNQAVQITQHNEAWVLSGDSDVFTTQPLIGDGPVASGHARIHYYRPDGNYSGWALYTWNASTENNAWCTSEVGLTGSDSFGVYFDLAVNASQGTPAGELDFIIINCADAGAKDPGVNQALHVTQSNQGWVISGDATVYTTQPPHHRACNHDRPHSLLSPRRQLLRMGGVYLERFNGQRLMVYQGGVRRWNGQLRRVLRRAGRPDTGHASRAAWVYYQQLPDRRDQGPWTESVPSGDAIQRGLGHLRNP